MTMTKKERAELDTALREVARLRREHERSFARGMLAALAVVHRAGMDTLYDEIAATIGIAALKAACTEDEDLDWSGLRPAIRRSR